MVRLEEICESKKKSNGTYVGVRFSKKTNKAIRDFVKENEIPNPDSIKENGGLHVTLAYSRKPLEGFKPKESVKMKAKVKGYTKFKEGKCLVMELDSPDLVKRHKQLRKDHGATHDFDSYIPHITLSTDAKEVDIKDLPKFKEPIEIVKEYSHYLEIDE